MSETEYLEFAGLVLEDDLLDHLATPEGATAVWKERLHPEVIPDSDQGIRDALRFVIEYMDEYREPPSIAVLAEETGYDEFKLPTAPIEYVISKLRDRYTKRNLREIIKKAARLSAAPHEAINYSLNELQRVKLETAPRGSTVTTKTLGSVLDNYLRAADDPEGMISFGYHLMDEHLGGLRLGELAVILARPKRYKSWQLTKSAVAAFMSEKNVFFETMELTEDEMSARFLCMVSGVSWYKYQRRLLSREELDHMDQTYREMLEWPATATFHRAKLGERNVANIVAHAQEAEADVVYIDQLSWFDGAKDERAWQKIGQVMEELKSAAQHFPIFMAAQYNRAQANEEGIGDIANIGLADAIGQTADLLLGMYASRDMLENKLLHLGIVESRSFEPTAWEVKVELTERSNFKMINTLD